jgi:hypothetical protein
MELTRRDAVAALAAVGATGAGGAAWAVTREGDDSSGPVPDEQELPGDERVRETLVAVAAVVYPSNVSGISEFVGAFVGPRLSGGQHATGLRETVGALNELAEEWHGNRGGGTRPRDTRALLREVGADTATSTRTGPTPSGCGTTLSTNCCWRCTRHRRGVNWSVSRTRRATPAGQRATSEGRGDVG